MVIEATVIEIPAVIGFSDSPTTPAKTFPTVQAQPTWLQSRRTRGLRC
jgi:hypothetical protein